MSVFTRFSIIIFIFIFISIFIIIFTIFTYYYFIFLFIIRVYLMSISTFINIKKYRRTILFVKASGPVTFGVFLAYPPFVFWPLAYLKKNFREMKIRQRNTPDQKAT